MTESTVDAMGAAKTAMQDKDWTTARRLLAPLVAENPHGIEAFHLARADLELGRPDMAAPLVVAFRLLGTQARRCAHARRPDPSGERTAGRGRVRNQGGD